MYGSVEIFRRYTDFTEADIGSAEVISFLEDAQKRFLSDVAIPRSRVGLEGAVDGANGSYTTTFIPLADSNFDKTVGTADIKVEVLKDDVYTEYSIGTLDPWRGLIVLSTIPPSKGTVVATFWQYFNPEGYPMMTLVWELVDLAVSVYAGHLVLAKKFLFVPDSMGLGSLRVSWAKKTDYRLLDLYRGFLEDIRRGFVRG